MAEGPAVPQLTLLNVEYSNAEPETYVLPLAIATGDRARDCALALAGARHRGSDEFGTQRRRRRNPFRCGSRSGFSDCAIRDHRASAGVIEARWASFCRGATQAFHQLRGDPESRLEPRVLKAEQSNSSVVYGDRFIIKLFRRIEAGLNPDLEIGRFLTSHALFSHVPPLAGWIDYSSGDGERRNIAVLQGFVPERGRRVAVHAGRIAPLSRKRGDQVGAGARDPRRRWSSCWR